MARLDIGKTVAAPAHDHEKGAVIRLKERLQFTGWLQYLPTAALALACFLVAVAGRAVGIWPLVLVWLPASVGAMLLAAVAFDLLTVKLGVHPPEALPAPQADLGAFDLMRARRSCRSFQARDLTEAQREKVLASARLHGRRDGLIGGGPVRFEYVAAPLTVWPVVGAHEFLVAIGPRAYDRMAIIDVGRSLQKVVLDATRMGVATCWIGPGADQTSVVRHLGDRFDPAMDHIVCVCAVGYRSRFVPAFIRFMQREQHRRLPLTSLFFAEARFRQPLDVQAPPFAAFGRCYEVCQWSPSSFNGQTTRCVAAAETVEGDVRAARFDFYASTPSRFYAPVALGIWCANWETGCEALGLAGHFAVVPPEVRGAPETQELPRYDVSWIVDRADPHLTQGVTPTPGRP